MIGATPILAVAVLVALGIVYVIAAAALVPNNAVPMATSPADTRGDISARYDAFVSGQRLDSERIERAFLEVRDRLKPIRFIFVPSYLSDSAIPSVGSGALGYMAGIRDWMAAAGIETEIADVETEETVEVNAARLRDIVAEGERRVCFVSHSKGGLDVLEFLLGAAPHDLNRVACWIALQAPFAGSPVADLAVSIPGMREVAGVVLNALGGRGESLDDLTTGWRGRYLERNDEATSAVFASVPTLCVATYMEDAGRLFAPRTWTYPTFVWMQAKSIRSDGLVPVASALRPCARYVVIEGLDHTDTVLSEALSAGMDQPSFMKLLLYLVLT